MAEVRTIKTCARCGVVISNLSDPNTVWQAHIRVKYCPQCRELKKIEWKKTKQRNYRTSKKEMQKQMDLLQVEIELLKEEIDKERNKHGKNKRA